MSLHVLSHTSIADQVAGSIVRSATSHSVGSLMRGHSVPGVIAIAVMLIVGVWLVKRFL